MRPWTRGCPHRGLPVRPLPDGAMGLVVNRLIDSLSFESLLAQLGVEAKGFRPIWPCISAGPLNPAAGLRVARLGLPSGLDPGDR